ncbi:MAG: DUF1684 domain-containing protein [Acidobacteria bacterium]|nr:DUF1684 domain-containing protein [Acidobacteriota bacterium]
MKRHRAPAAPSGVLRTALALAALAAAACGGGAPPEEQPPADLAFASEEAIGKDRAKKDEILKTDADSAIPEELRASFTALEYYPYDAGLRFAAKLRRYPDPPPIKIITTMGKERPAVKAGYLEFTRDGKRHRLQVYSLRDKDIPREDWGNLFLPFLDATSGQETYGAGRYLDLEARPDDWYVIDFNQAYHPLCAYGRTIYRCPRTPEENRLPFPVRAGEKGWVDHGPGETAPAAAAAAPPATDEKGH